MTKGRWLVVVALIPATLTTAWVLLYHRGGDLVPQTGGIMVAVVVSKVDIPAGTDLNQLIKDEQFEIIEVSQVAVVDGAVTSVDLLTDMRNTVAILAGEQIKVGWLKNAA